MRDLTILIVDDEEQVTNSLARLFRRQEYQVFTASGGQQGLELLSLKAIHIVLADYQMPKMNGIEFLSQVKQHYPETIRMMLTASDDFSTINQAVNRCGIFKYVVKPWDSRQLLNDIEQAFRQFELQNQRLQISKLFEQTIEGLVFTSSSGEIEVINPAFKRIAQVNDEIIGSDLNQILHTDDDHLFFSIIEKSIESKQQWHGELRCGVSLTQSVPVWVAVTPIDDVAGAIERLAVILVDISEQAARESEYSYQAWHDELTDLPNSRFFQMYLNQSIDKVRRNQQKVGILFMDLNGFKQVNDAFGHSVGDWLLKQVAARLADLIREEDKLSRIGGDEFTVVLGGVRDRTQCQLLAKRIKKAFAQPFIYQEQTLQIGISVGSALFPDDADGVDELIELADQKMYQEKNRA